MVDPELLKFVRLEVHVRRVVLVHDRPWDARAAPHGERILARRYGRLAQPSAWTSAACV